MSLEEELREHFERRWKSSIENREFPIPGSLKENLWEKMLVRFKMGFKCAYCDQKLITKGPKYHTIRNFSFDHKKPLHHGGDNSLDNIEVVCYRCNILKSTMTLDTYKKLVSKTDSKFLDKMYNELLAGRMAGKREQESLQRQMYQDIKKRKARRVKTPSKSFGDRPTPEEVDYGENQFPKRCGYCRLAEGVDPTQKNPRFLWCTRLFNPDRVDNLADPSSASIGMWTPADFGCKAYRS
ncbi:hypothetical protein ES703_93865 [subsurface metagenome]